MNAFFINKHLYLLIFLIFSMQSVGDVMANRMLLFDIQQNRTATVRGKITDTGGDPLAGATVQLKGSTRGVIADVDGNYEFADCPIGSTLVVSFIGMESIEQVYSGESRLDFVMKFQADELDEVEVVAFARQKKESVLASISTVKPAELKVPSSNLTTAFAGRVAGLISYQTTGLANLIETKS